MKIKLPEKRFFTVQELAERWECQPSDVVHLVESGELQISQKQAALHGKRRIYFGYYGYTPKPDRPCWYPYPPEDKVAEWESKALEDEHIVHVAVPCDFDFELPENQWLVYQGSKNEIDDWLADIPGRLDGVILLRDVLDFESRYIQEETGGKAPSEQKQLSTTERNSLLTIIAALCYHCKIDPKAWGTTAEITRMTEEIGAPLSADNVGRKLKEIPEALESRMK